MLGHHSENSDIESIFIKNDDLKGYALQIIHTSASEIDPWLIIVKRVSPILRSIADVYRRVWNKK